MNSKIRVENRTNEEIWNCEMNLMKPIFKTTCDCCCNLMEETDRTKNESKTEVANEQFTIILLEYFEHGDTTEVALSLEDMQMENKQDELIQKAVILAMERKHSQREMISILISDLYGLHIFEKHISEAFYKLLLCLPDLILDTPDAPIILGNFIARAIADDCLPPRFIYDFIDIINYNHARSSLEHAKALLTIKHGLVRLDNIWGIGGGMRPIKYLIKKIRLLLKEYLCSGDVLEAERCVQELEVPHFHHELIYEAVVMMIEDAEERTMELLHKLIQSLATGAIVSPYQLKQGFERVYKEMDDIRIDVPHAYISLEKIVMRCYKNGILPEYLMKEMPRPVRNL
ncbi:programmed cell death protein 4-like isoform X1 [Centruroides sculpturatus]|uniref:programmed cell death protein 4-like isoform X1 n=3 Tax=Centruroides sculpturatus TaxID=218467 RepID=UPI000C6D4532|nr:programmed cell death protein 4-like isoform X1 [Centruroides sculpturatus]